MDSGWGGRRRSNGSETLLKRSEFLLELVNTESEFVKWKRLDSGFHSADGRKRGEGKNGANKEKRNQNEEERCHGGGAKRIRAQSEVRDNGTLEAGRRILADIGGDRAKLGSSGAGPLRRRETKWRNTIY